MLDRYPQLYQLGQSNSFFTPMAFWQWIGNAFYHSAVSSGDTFELCIETKEFVSTAFVHALPLCILGRSEAS